MPEESTPGPIISEDELIRLAGLLDKWWRAFDDRQPDVRHARDQFDMMILGIYQTRIAGLRPEISHSDFYDHVLRNVRERIPKARKFPCP